MRLNLNRNRTLSRRPSQDLADRLVLQLGFSGAIRACRENHWFGAQMLIEKRLSNTLIG